MGGYATGYVASGGDQSAAFLGSWTALFLMGVGNMTSDALLAASETGRSVWTIRLTQTLAHGVIGGILSAAQGGKASRGFWSAFASSVAAPGISRLQGGPVVRVGFAAIVGGTVSKAAGGKFANGAVTGAFVQAFNHEAHRLERAKAEARMIGDFLRDEGLDVLYRTATTVGGAGQVLLGGAICTTGIGCAAGGTLAVLGASNIQEGLSGQPGFVRQGATAAFGDTGGNLAVDAANITSSGAGLLRPVLQPNTFKLFRNIPSDFAPAYRSATTTGLAAEAFAGSVGAAETLDRRYGQ